MFECKLKVVDFKKILSVCKIVSSEGIFQFTENGLLFGRFDTVNVFGLVLKLNRNIFTDYSYSEDVEIGIDIEKLLNVIPNHKQEDEVILTYKDKKLILQFPAYKITMTNIINLGLKIYGEAVYDRIMSVSNKLPYTFNANKDTFKEAFAMVKKVSTDKQMTTCFLCENGTVKIQHEFDSNELESVICNEFGYPDIVSAQYSGDYIIDFINGIEKISDTLKISLNTDFPMIWRIEESDWEIVAVLAPRIVDKGNS